MSWQEELRRLDADLSAGRIGHTEHRRKREELLAEASGGGAASPVASPLRPTGPGNAGGWPLAAPAAGRWKGEPPVRWTSGPSAPGPPAGPGGFAGPGGYTGQGTGQGDGGQNWSAAAPGPAATVPGETDHWAAGSDPTVSMTTATGSETDHMTGVEGTTSATGSPTTASANGTASTAGATSANGTADMAGATSPATWASADPATQQPANGPSATQVPTARQPTWHPVQPGAGEQPSDDGKPASKPSKSPKPPKPAKGFRASKESTAQTPSWEPKAVGDFHTNRRTTAPSPADVNPTDYFAVSGDDLDKQPTPELRQLWEEAPPRRQRPTWLFLSLGVLLALALIVGLTWYLGGKPDQQGTADSVSAPPVPSPSGSAGPSATLEDKLPALPGKPSQDNSTMSLDKAVELKAVSQADAELMKTASSVEVVYRSYADTEQADNGTVLLAVPTGSSAQAEQLVKGLQGNLVAGGFDSAELGPAPTDLLYSGSSPAGRVLAFWYTSGPVAIGIGASQPLAGDEAGLRSRIGQIRAKVAAALPAG